MEETRGCQEELSDDTLAACAVNGQASGFAEHFHLFPDSRPGNTQTRASFSPENACAGFPSRTWRSLARRDMRDIEAAIEGGGRMRQASHRNAVGTEFRQRAQIGRLDAAGEFDLDSRNGPSQDPPHAI